MGETKKMRPRKRNRGSNRSAVLCILGVLFVLMGAVFTKSGQLRKKNEGYEARIAQLQAQIEEESERASDIEALKEYVHTPEYTREAAREKLGMVGEDEILFKAED